MTGGRRGGSAQDIADGAGDVIDGLIDHQWTCDQTEKSRRRQVGCRGPKWDAKEALSLGVGIS